MLRLMLTDAIWDKLGPLLPAETGRKCRPAKDNRKMVEGILWRFRTGAPWRDLPEPFGPWESVYSRFNRWSKAGVWERAFAALRSDIDDEWNFMDGTIVKAHQHAAGGKKGAIMRLERAAAAVPLRYTCSPMHMVTRFFSRSPAAKCTTLKQPRS